MASWLCSATGAPRVRLRGRWAKEVRAESSKTFKDSAAQEDPTQGANGGMVSAPPMGWGIPGRRTSPESPNPTK